MRRLCSSALLHVSDRKVLRRSGFQRKDRRWAIRFGTDGTVTLVLGMKDYGRGWFSGYFASLVAARLEVPFHRVRLYYSGTFPAVLQKPTPLSMEVHREHIGPVASAAADTIERLCDLVVEDRHPARELQLQPLEAGPA